MLIAKRCVELDPSVPDFHHYLGCMLGSVGAYKHGLRALDRALELLPNQLGWLYDRASITRLAEEKKEQRTLERRTIVYILLKPT